MIADAGPSFQLTPAIFSNAIDAGGFGPVQHSILGKFYQSTRPTQGERRNSRWLARAFLMRFEFDSENSALDAGVAPTALRQAIRSLVASRVLVPIEGKAYQINLNFLEWIFPGSGKRRLKGWPVSPGVQVVYPVEFYRFHP